MSFEREPEDMRKHGNTIKRCIPECHSAPFHYILLVSHPTGKSPRQKVLTFFYDVDVFVSSYTDLNRSHKWNYGLNLWKMWKWI